MRKLFLAFLTLTLLVSATGVSATAYGWSSVTANNPNVLGSVTTPPAQKVVVKVVDTSCMKQAITLREAGFKMAYQTLSSDIAQVLDVRATGLVNAWDTADAKARNKAIKAVWTKFGVDAKNAGKKFGVTVALVWKVYTTAAKACKIDGKPADLSAENINTFLNSLKTLFCM